jgi:hypothetical protein
MWDIIIDTTVLALISSLFIASGLRVLLAKRPFIAGGRWWGILWIAPMTLKWINILLSEYAWQDRESTFFAYMGTGCMAVLLGLILWAPGGGSIVIGATATTLRDALRTALSRLGLSYEESAKAFRLPALNNELFAQAPLAGVFFLRFKRFRGLRAMLQLARQLAPEVKEFFKTAPVRINKRLGYALVLIGVAFLLLDSLVTYERLSLRARMTSLDEAHTEFFAPSEK